MKKRSKKISFRFGKDANKMLQRKLVKNFITYGNLTSTEKKIKFLRNNIEKIITYAKKNTQATRNLINRKIHDKKVISILFKNITPVFENKTSGFVKITKLKVRDSDGSKIAKLEWSIPVIIETKSKDEKKTAKIKAPAQKTTKKEKGKESKKQVKSKKK